MSILLIALAVLAWLLIGALHGRVLNTFLFLAPDTEFSVFAILLGPIGVVISLGNLLFGLFLLVAGCK